MKEILLVEDDRTLSNGIMLALQNQEYEIRQCFTLKEARKNAGSADLIILDLNLPDGNGLDYLKELRKESNIKIILLTANDLEMDIVIGLELGADDYITKPFSLAVLRARVNTQLRKLQTEKEELYRCGEYRFDFATMTFYVGEESVELSKTEQKLLRLLVEHKGMTLERDLLIDKIWTDGAEYVDENALSVTIKRLRDKLERKCVKKHIKTVYGIGYVWEE